jgi:hypothetical protein
MANDLNLHRCITKMPHVKTECYERTRLYFIVYVCDHHCSLPYGRPSMTPEFHTLKPAKSFLQSKFCTSSDVKLISQVELWSVSSKVFDIFGADVEASVTEGREKELDLLGRSFDLCMSSDTALNSTADVFWERLSELHIHCAKLSLFSHIFRGSAQRHGRSPSTPFHGMEKFERSSLESALAIVRAVAWGEEIQKRLAILPSYFGTMIAFASITLIKAWGKEPTMCYLDKNEVSTTLNRLVEVFQACAGRIQSEHPLRSVARSLKIALNGSCCHMEEIHGSMGFMPNAIDNAVFDFGDFGNGGLGMDYVGDQNNSLAYTGDFHSSLFGM